MKKAKYVLIMILSLMISISCNNDDDNDMTVNTLVGTWAITETIDEVNFSSVITFNENLTGKMVFEVELMGQTRSDTYEFTWSTEGDELTLVIDGDSETSGYSITGNKLTINIEDETLVLTRQ